VIHYYAECVYVRRLPLVYYTMPLMARKKYEMHKKIIRFLSFLLPRLVSSLAYRTLMNPQVRKLRKHELDFLAQAEKRIIKHRGLDIQTYRWGNALDEKILLIHGWEGQAGNFTDVVQKLLESQYYILAFDAPSHGFSSKSKTSLFEFGDFVEYIIKDFNCKKLISHSMGGVMTTYALFKNQDLRIDKYVLLTTPDKFTEKISLLINDLGISKKVETLLINKIESEMEVNVRELNVSNFVKNINVKKALIIHDKNDQVIPISQPRNVNANWKESQLIEIEGTGHFRILRTEEVIKSVVEFLK